MSQAIDRKKSSSKTLQKRRNLIERFFECSKRRRHIATRYVKKPEDFSGFISLVALILGMI